MEYQDLVFPKFKKQEVKQESEVYFGNDHKKLIFEKTLIAKTNEPIYIALNELEHGYIIIQFVESTDDINKNGINWEVLNSNLYITILNLTSQFDTVINDKIVVANLNDKALYLCGFFKKIGVQYISNFQFYLGENNE